MKRELKCIMLVDDNLDNNFFHERAIKKADLKNIVITRNSGREALDYIMLKTDPACDLIFLDINMPGMNGWEFLEEYKQLDNELQSQAIIIILTTSDNSDDFAKAKTYSIVSDYITKPLTKELIKEITDKYFK